jgi:hypothetical protein
MPHRSRSGRCLAPSASLHASLRITEAAPLLDTDARHLGSQVPVHLPNPARDAHDPADPCCWPVDRKSPARSIQVAIVGGRSPAGRGLGRRRGPGLGGGPPWAEARHWHARPAGGPGPGTQ